MNAGPLTPAEQEALQKRNTQLENEGKERDNRNFFMRMLSGLWDNIGLFIIAGLLWFAAKMNPDFVGRIVEMLPESWQANVSGFLNMLGIDVDMEKPLRAMKVEDFQKKVLEGALKIPATDAKNLLPDLATKNTLLDIIVAANQTVDAQGKPVKPRITEATFTNDKTLYALITQDKIPNFLPRLVAALPKPADGKIEGKMLEVLKSMQTIVKDDQKVTALFTTHYSTTLQVIQTLNPSISPQELRTKMDAFVKLGGVASGKPNAFFKESLTRMLTPDANGKLPDPLATVFQVAGSDKDVRAHMIDDYIKQQQRPHADAVIQLRAAMGDEKVQQLATLAKGANPIGDGLRFALDPAHREHLPLVIAAIDTAPQTAGKMPVKLADLMPIIQRTGMAADGTPNPALATLIAGITSGQSVSMESLVPMLKNYVLSPEVSQNAATAQALQDLARKIDIAKLPETQRPFVAFAREELTAPRLAALGQMKANGINDPLSLMARFIERNADGKAVPSLRKGFEAVLNPALNAELQKAGAQPLATLISDKVPLLNAKNIEALLTFGQAISGNNNNFGAQANGTSKIYGMLLSAIEDPCALKEKASQITPKEVAQFFNDPSNQKAIAGLLNTIDRNVLNPQQRAMLEGLTKLQGDHSRTGLIAVLKSEVGAAYLLKKIQEGPATGVSGWLGSFSFVQSLHFVAQDDVVFRNKESITQLGELLNKAGASNCRVQENSTPMPHIPRDASNIGAAVAAP
jgi:hypothetical protein